MTNAEAAFECEFPDGLGFPGTGCGGEGRATSPLCATRQTATASACATVQDYMASRSVNKVILVGHLGRDAETKFTPGGAAVTRFSVATSRRWKDQQSGEWKEETDWSNVTLWRSENLATYLTKGKQVYVEGRLHTRSYEDKDGKKVYATEVVADEVILLGGQGGGGGRGGGDEYSQQPVSMPRGAQRAAPAASQQNDDQFPQGITDDDVPF